MIDQHKFAGKFKENLSDILHMSMEDTQIHERMT